MADQPETLEQTQARLARLQHRPAMPPATSVPIATVIAPTGSPVRHDPSGASHHLRPEPRQPVAASRRPLGIVGIAVGIVSMVAVAGGVAYNAFESTDSSDSVYSEEWQNFPGVSWSDPNIALEQPSYEEVVAAADRLLAEYRDATTAEFGLVWTQRYEERSGLESNGFDGDSMLYYYETGTWQGQVQLDDPSARERIYAIFSELSVAFGGDSDRTMLSNEFSLDDAVAAREEFGAETLSDQARWSFSNEFAALAGGYVVSDVMDRSIPTDDSFTGDYRFSYDGSSDTLYVVVEGHAGLLLKEGDRAAYEAALEPYDGVYTP